MKTGSSLPVSFISLRLERVDNLGAYRIPPKIGILIPSDFAILTFITQIGFGTYSLTAKNRSISFITRSACSL
jgi:hypothetical protein